MKRLFLNRIFLITIAFLTGGAVMWAVTKYSAHKEAPAVEPFSIYQDPDKFFSDFLNDDFFDRSREPLEEMRREQREDADFLYYEIDLKGHTPKEVNVEVKDGQVFISGQMESQEDHDGKTSYYSSSFQRSFPIPHDVDAEKFQMAQEDKKIVVKFPKKKLEV